MKPKAVHLVGFRYRSCFDWFKKKCFDWLSSFWNCPIIVRDICG